MRLTVVVSTLFSFALLVACATPSRPLITTPGADVSAAKHNAEGIEHYNMGHWDVAKKHFEAAIKSDPKAAEPQYNLALTLHELGVHSQATDYFKKAAELAPGNTAITESSAYRSHTRPVSGFDGGRGYGMSGYGY